MEHKILKKIVIAGSFAAFEEMKRLAEKLARELKVEIILPKHFRGYQNGFEIEELKRGFKNGEVELEPEDFYKIGQVESWFWEQIDEADIILVYNKKQNEGEVGINTAMDIGYVLGKGKEVIFLYPPSDAGIKGLLTYTKKKAKIVSLDRIINYLKNLS